MRKQKTMSEEEHFTGEYYLDNKPIYAKTIHIESLPNATTQTYEHNINNIDVKWIDASKSYIVWNTGSIGMLPIASPSSSIYNIVASLNDNNHILIQTGSDRRTV